MQKKSAPQSASSGTAKVSARSGAGERSIGAGRIARSNLAIMLAAAVLLAIMVFGAANQTPGGDSFAPAPSLLTASGWIEPIERNRFLRLPAIRANLNAVTFNADGRRGWAVGEAGTIVHTDDGGETWVEQNSPLSAAAALTPKPGKVSAFGWLPQARAQEAPPAPPPSGRPSQNRINAPGDSPANLPNQMAPLPASKAGLLSGSESASTANNPPAGPAALRQLAPQRQQSGNAQTEVAPATRGAPETASRPVTNKVQPPSVAKQAGQTPVQQTTVPRAAASAGEPVEQVKPPEATEPTTTATTTELAAGGDQGGDPLRADLRGVFFNADGQRGWAVGSNGTILATGNGGANWQVQMSATKSLFRSVAFSADGQRAWAVGDRGTILATSNGGINWQAQTSGTTSWLESVTLSADGQRGWAVGEDGTVLATRDGGATWLAQTSGTKSSLLSVALSADGQRGWVVGTGGTILATRDGGATWQAQTSGITSRLQSVASSPDGQRGWAVGQDGTMLATRDGGATWQAQTSGTKSWLQSVALSADGQRGWAVGDDGTMLATRDGGATWQARTSGTKSWLQSVAQSADGQRSWAVGNEGTILATRDGGATWQAQTSGTKSWLYSVALSADGQLGWAVGDGGTILATRDGGGTWQAQTSGTKSWLWSVALSADGQRGRAVGNGGTILATRDGGATWQAQTGGTKSLLLSVALSVDGQRGWAVGDDGTVLATRDGGVTWQAQTSGTKSGLYSVALSADGQRGWVAGREGTILATRDGGATWQVQTSGAKSALRSIAFATDGQRGWAVGNEGTILATRNGGDTWQAQKNGTKSWTKSQLQSVAFSTDGQRGASAGYDGTILSTRDGGEHWEPASYRRYPAPWFYAASILLLAGAAALCYRNLRNLRPERQVHSIVDKGESDEPISRIDQDRLGFGPLALGLAGYLRNAATLPPLTVAISAPWGRGKSSVMRMLETEMAKVGVKSVWFNAWHHQKEKVMLAALLQSIRERALPFWLSFDGVRFRIRLLWLRLRAHTWLALIGFCALLLPVWHLAYAAREWITNKPETGRGWVEYLADSLAHFWDAGNGVANKQLFDKLADGKLTEFAAGLTAAILGKPEVLLDGLGMVLLAGVLFVLFAYGLRAFPDSPAVLLASLANKSNQGDIEAQTGYRQRFKMHFADVCEALRPRTMLIFIDDLDRCEPDKTAEMLEAVNYLVNSGRCFIVLGMARNVVEAQLAHHYKDLADAYSLVMRVSNAGNQKSASGPAGIGSPMPITGAATADAAQHDRITYVQSYLRKLINLEVRVPQLRPEQIKQLLEIEQQQQDERRVWRKRADAAGRWWHGWARVPVRWGLALAGATWLVFTVTSGLESWNKNRLDTLKKGRVIAEATLTSIGDSERRIAVALDYARGTEKKIANDLFDHFGIAVAGLAFNLPVERRAPSGAIDSEICAPPATTSAVDKPGLAATAEAVGRTRLLNCWKQTALAARAIETQHKNVRTALEAASAAKVRDDFGRIEREGAKARNAAEQVEGAAGMAARPSAAKPGATPEASPGRDSGGASGGMVDHHVGPATWPYWLMLVAILAAGIFFVARREPYVLHDERQFEESMGIWSELLDFQPELAVPREIKRYQNRARFYAMRLRAISAPLKWIDRVIDRFDQRAEPKPVLKTSIAEEVIVGLTAVYQICPQLLARYSPLFGGLQQPEADSAAAKVLVEVRAIIEKYNRHAQQQKDYGRDFAVWPSGFEAVRSFVEIVEEFQPAREDSANMRPAA